MKKDSSASELKQDRVRAIRGAKVNATLEVILNKRALSTTSSQNLSFDDKLLGLCAVVQQNVSTQRAQTKSNAINLANLNTEILGKWVMESFSAERAKPVR